MSIEISRVGDIRAWLGESPVWDRRSSQFHWVDSAKGMVYRLDPSTGRTEEWRVPGTVGSLALCNAEKLLLASNDGFYALDLATGGLTTVAAPEQDNHRVRFNDGKVDKAGRFISGTVVRPANDGAFGKLFRLNADLSVETLETDVIISNGPSFSPDGSTMYYMDSARHHIYSYAYSDTGLSDKTLFFDTTGMGCIPDGSTVDSEGFLWFAMVFKGMICRLDPAGRIDRTIEVPTPFPTSMNFGGPDLDILYLTSASHSETGRFNADNPNSGHLFCIRGLGVTGIAERPFAGRLP